MGGLAALRERLAVRSARSLPETMRHDLLPEGGLRRAAVLVPLFEHEGEVHVLLTLRRADLRHHGGQVSFPGGRLEPGEEARAAALREAQEEVGLEPERVELIGQLDETLVLATGFRLTPWVGVVPYPYPYVAHPGEVESLLYISFTSLLRPQVHHSERREAYGMVHEVHYYELPLVTVWGATARVLHQLLALWSAT